MSEPDDLTVVRAARALRAMEYRALKAEESLRKQRKKTRKYRRKWGKSEAAFRTARSQHEALERQLASESDPSVLLNRIIEAYGDYRRGLISVHELDDWMHEHTEFKRPL